MRLPLSRVLLLAGAAALVVFALGYLVARGGSPGADASPARLGSVTVETAGVKVSALAKAPPPPALGRGERRPRTNRGGGGGNGPVVTTTPTGATPTPTRPTPPRPTPTRPTPTPAGIPGD